MAERDELVRVIAEALRRKAVEHVGAATCGTCDWSESERGIEHEHCPCCDTYCRGVAAAILDVLVTRWPPAARAGAAGRVTHGMLEAAAAEMSKVEKLLPQATLDALLRAALPALGMSREHEGGDRD